MYSFTSALDDASSSIAVLMKMNDPSTACWSAR
jgi:hypothetical protein